MHEGLSGGASPCQGEGRGFESRLVLFFLPGNVEKAMVSGLFCVWKAVDNCMLLLCYILRKSVTHVEIVRKMQSWYDIRETKENVLKVRHCSGGKV